MIPQSKIAAYLQKVFNPYMEADLDVWQAFAEKMIHREFGKNEIIKPANTIEKYLNVIVKGSGGLFLWNENNEVCSDICFENQFFNDQMSLLSETASPYYTRALEPMKVISIYHLDLKQILESSMAHNKIGKVAAEALFMTKQEQQMELLTSTAEKRYANLVSKYSEQINRIPDKVIASYLGITPESFSRLKKK